MATLLLREGDELAIDRLDFDLTIAFFRLFIVPRTGGESTLSLMDDRPESSIDETDRSLQETATDLGMECFVEYGNEPISSAAFIIFLYFKGEIAACWLLPLFSGTSETYFCKSFRAIILTFFLGDGGGDVPRCGYFGAVSS